MSDQPTRVNTPNDQQTPDTMRGEGDVSQSPSTLPIPEDPSNNPPTPPVEIEPKLTIDQSTNTNKSAPKSDNRAPKGYIIERELGRGGMGVVYLAKSVALKRPCALKMILSGAHASKAELQRFQTEAEAIARVQHNGIVQVYEVGIHDDMPFMALEYCGGGSLQGALAQNPLTPTNAAKVVKALAEAMHAAHQTNIIHRDLKPGNILLATPGVNRPSDELIPKITDFGLAKKLDEEGETRTGSIMGTPSFMPPEQARGDKNIGPLADVYSLGAILYTCLASRPPFRAATAMETVRQVLELEPITLRSLDPKIPADLETITNKCLQKDSSKRYPSAQSLAEDLGRWLNNEPILARPVGSIERAKKWIKRNQVLTLMLATIFFVLLAGVAFSSWFAYDASREAEFATKANAKAQANKLEADNNATESKKNAENAKQNAERAEQKARDEEAANKLAQQRLELANKLRREAEGLTYARTLALTESSFLEGNASLVKQYLNDCQWNFREWEYRYLRTRVDSQQTLQHTSVVNCLAWSPDGKRIAAGCGKGLNGSMELRVWDAQTGAKLLQFAPHKARILGVAWSPDSKHFATTGSGSGFGGPGEVKVWNAETGQQVRSIAAHDLGATCVAYSPDGKSIFSGSGEGVEKGGEGKIWHVDRIGAKQTLKGHTEQINAAAWSPDSKQILTASQDKTAIIWNAETGEILHTLKRESGAFYGAAWSPDGSTVATCGGSTDGSQGETRLWDAKTGKELQKLKLQIGWVLVCAFSPDSQKLVTAGYDKLLHIWDVKTGEELSTLKGHVAEVYALSWNPDARRIASASFDTTVKIWDMEHGQEPVRIKRTPLGANQGSWSPDHEQVALANMKGTFVIRNLRTGLDKEIKAHTKAISRIVWSPDGEKILTASEDQTLKIWNAKTGEELQALKGHVGQVSAASWNPKSQTIISGCKSGELRLWDANTGTEIQKVASLRQSVEQVEWSPDGKYFLVASRSSHAGIWTLDQLDRGPRLLKGYRREATVAVWSPDQKYIVTNSPSSAAHVWEVASGEEILTMRGHTRSIDGLAWSPDGKRIATVSSDYSVKLWDFPSGQEVLTFRDEVQGMASVAWSRNGEKLLITSVTKQTSIREGTKQQVNYMLTQLSDLATQIVWSPNNEYLLVVSRNSNARIWDVQKGREVTDLIGVNAGVAPKGSPEPKGGWSPDSRYALLRDSKGVIVGYDLNEARPLKPEQLPVALAEFIDPKPMPKDGIGVISPNSRFAAIPSPMRGIDGFTVNLLDRKQSQEVLDTWTFPNSENRKAYHLTQANQAKKDNQPFAETFHLGRLLIDDPDNGELKERLDKIGK